MFATYIAVCITCIGLIYLAINLFPPIADLLMGIIGSIIATYFYPKLPMFATRVDQYVTTLGSWVIMFVSELKDSIIPLYWDLSAEFYKDRLSFKERKWYLVWKRILLSAKYMGLTCVVVPNITFSLLVGKVSKIWSRKKS